MPDLGVYNLTHAHRTARAGEISHGDDQHRDADAEDITKGEIKVEAEDNAMVLLDHGDAKISCVQCGFNFFNPHGHEGKAESRHTVAIYRSAAAWGLSGTTGNR